MKSTQAGGQKEMSVLGHLDELRVRLLRAGIVSLVLVIISLVFYERILDLFLSVINDIVAESGGTLARREPTEVWSVAVRIAVMVGLAASLPYLLFELWLYIRPALKKREVTSFILVVPGAVLFFGGGVFFAYYVISPFLFRFLLGFGGGIEEIQTVLSVSSTVNLQVSLMFSVGIIFLIPILMYVLGRFGIIKRKSLSKKRRLVILGAVILGAALTPTIDPLTQVLVAGPIVVLFEIGLILLWLNERSQKEVGTNSPSSS